MKRTLFLFALVLLLTPSGSAVAQPSTTYVTQRFVTTSGGSAHSASYSVTAVIGQPLTDVASSTSYKVSGGFLHGSQMGHELWLPLISK